MPNTKVLPIPVLGRRNVNAYLLLGDRPILVDSGIPGSGRKISDRITAYGVDPREVSLIVLTHGHIDHFGSATELHRLTGAPVAAHIADLPVYRSGRILTPYRPTGPMGRFLARRRSLHARTEPVDPTVLVQGRTPLHDFGVHAHIVPTPGHTPGSISVLTETGDLIAGDLIASSFMGLLAHRPANPPFHDDPLRNLASLREMLALNPTRLHIGHGGPLNPARVERWATRHHQHLHPSLPV